MGHAGQRTLATRPHTGSKNSSGDRLLRSPSASASVPTESTPGDRLRPSASKARTLPRRTSLSTLVRVGSERGGGALGPSAPILPASCFGVS